MSTIDAIIIPQTAQQTAQVLAMALADGLAIGRLEPIVDAANWAAGMQVTVWARVRDAAGNEVAGWSGTVSKSIDRSGAPIASALEILAPFPAAGYTLDAGFDADRSAPIGLRLTAAPDLASLPAQLSPPSATAPPGAAP